MTSFRELGFEPAELTERDIQRLFNVFNESLSAQYLNDFIKLLEYTGLFSLTGERLSYTLTKTIEYGEKLIKYRTANNENQGSIEVIDFWKQSILKLQTIINNPPVNSVTIDFGNLEPVHINYISDTFETVNFFKAIQWKHDFSGWLNANILKKNQVAVLEKSLLYGQRRYLYYQENECTHGENCPNRKMFEDKIEFFEYLIHNKSKKQENQPIVAHINRLVPNIPSPVRALFCYCVLQCKLIPMDENESIEKYCRRVCMHYNLLYSDRVRQNFQASYSKANARKVKELILPAIDPNEAEQIAKYLDIKS